jgi:hypothetical protein
MSSRRLKRLIRICRHGFEDCIRILLKLTNRRQGGLIAGAKVRAAAAAMALIEQLR